MGSRIHILYLNTRWIWAPECTRHLVHAHLLIFRECINLIYNTFERVSAILKLIWSFSKSSLAVRAHCYLSSKQTDWNILMPVQFPLNEKEDGFNLPHAVKRKRERIPRRVQCIIPVNILMYVWDWSKGKIPSETKVRREAEMVMFIFICPLLGETCTLPLNHSWIINAHTAQADLFAITSDDGFVWKPLDLVLNIIILLCHWHPYKVAKSQPGSSSSSAAAELPTWRFGFRDC